jgi:hypothetical protein
MLDPYEPVALERVHGREIGFTSSDHTEFAGILRGRWPNIRFVASDGSDSGRLRDEVWLEDEGRWLDPYVPAASLSCGATHAEALLVADDWVPDWRHFKIWGPGERSLETRFRLANPPTTLVRYTQGHFVPGVPVMYGSLWLNWPDPERQRGLDLRTVFRLLAKFACNKVDEVYDDTGAVRRAGTRTGTYFGPGVAAWCAADPVRRLLGRFRPAGSLAAPLPRELWQRDNCEQPHP